MLWVSLPKNVRDAVFLSSLIVKIEVMLHKKLAPPQGSRRMKAPPMLSPDSLLVLAAAVALGAITTPSSQETLTVPTVRGSGPTDRWLYVSSRFHRAGVSDHLCGRRSPRISTESNCLSWLTLPSALQLAWSRAQSSRDASFESICGLSGYVVAAQNFKQLDKELMPGCRSAASSSSHLSQPLIL